MDFMFSEYQSTPLGCFFFFFFCCLSTVLLVFLLLLILAIWCYLGNTLLKSQSAFSTYVTHNKNSEDIVSMQTHSQVSTVTSPLCRESRELCLPYTVGCISRLKQLLGGKNPLDLCNRHKQITQNCIHALKSQSLNCCCNFSRKRLLMSTPRPLLSTSQAHSHPARKPGILPHFCFQHFPKTVMKARA